MTYIRNGLGQQDQVVKNTATTAITGAGALTVNDISRFHNENVLNGQIDLLLADIKLANAGWLVLYALVKPDKRNLLNDRRLVIFKAIDTMPLTPDGRERLIERKSEIDASFAINWPYVLWSTVGAMVVIPAAQWLFGQAKEKVHKKIKKKFSKNEFML